MSLLKQECIDLNETKLNCTVEEHLNDSKPKTNNLKIFRYADRTDVVLMVIGTASAVCNGTIFPLMLVFYGNILDSFNVYSINCDSSHLLLNTSTPKPNYKSIDIKSETIWIIVLAVATIILSYLQITFWMITAEKQSRELRLALFKSILSQDMAWFDVTNSSELNNRLSQDVNKVRDGIGDKFGNSIQFISSFVTSLVISFIYGWKLTLVILAFSPILLASSAIFGKLVEILTTKEMNSYAKAGAVAEEVLNSIRTVFAYNGGHKEHERYVNHLNEARLFGIKKALITGALMGLVWIVMNGAHSLGFWYGWKLTKDDPNEYTVGRVLMIFFSLMFGLTSIGNGAPFYATFLAAKATAIEIFKIIDRKPNYKIMKPTKLNSIKCLNNYSIRFQNVNFTYPSRSDVSVLKDLSFEVKEGQTIALVGSSGCGKSTCIQLLQRFYDPLSGSIEIGNMDIKELDVNELRQLIGVVNQEPILFDTTIEENIRLGNVNATIDEIETAAKNANAHDFIMNLPKKYKTLVGDGGCQLSGGQKQRIAIARALVKNPKILLLDEATSALDNQSESIVQMALENASQGRTTIVVAHRLSTIKNSDMIFVLDGGKICEFGNHDELINRNGVYHKLYTNQSDADKSQQKVEYESTETEQKENQKFNESEHFSVETKFSKQNMTSKSKNWLLRVIQLNKPEWVFILLGCIGSLVTGAVQPVFSIVSVEVIAAFQICDLKEQEKKVVLLVILFLVIGVITFLSNVLQSSMFGISGENLTKRLRSDYFKAILSQEIAWFDETDNNAGSLCARLSTEAAAVQAATGVRLGFFLMNVGNLGIGIILSFVYGWTLALVALGFVPFMIMSGVLQTKMLTGFAIEDQQMLEDAGKIAAQSIRYIRTVVSLNREEYFANIYSKTILNSYRAAIKSANVYGALFGFTNSIVFFSTAAIYYLGSYLMDKILFGINFKSVNLVFNCIIIGAQATGQSATLMPDYAKAKIAIKSIFKLFDRTPKINNWLVDEGKAVKNEEFEAKISFRDVEFQYPSRPNVKVLKQISFTVEKGQKVALVGSSGCGKSTIVQLIERFYDPKFGSVTLSGENIKELNLNWFRSKIGIVFQEPILFDRSIEENIAYGDNSRVVPTNEIIEAAKKANIHEFIKNLPEAYKTNVGSRGTQLSGGQKQRIAIARALIRNPNILILDESTSALDSESEKIVQEALDEAQIGKTCIIIAHRLSTIKNADVIYVIKDGEIIESGSHEQLINKHSYYSKMYFKTQ